MNRLVKQQLSEKCARWLLSCLVVVLVLLPVHAFLSTWLGTQIGPLLVWKSWKEILLLLLVPVVVLYCWLQPAIAKYIWAQAINKIIAAYVVLHLLLTIIARASTEAVIAGLLMNLRFFALFVLAQLVIASRPDWLNRLKVWIPTWLLWTMIGLSVMAILQVTILPKDFLIQFGYDKDLTIAPVLLVDDNPDALRAFATMRGPNTLGAYLILPLLVAVYYLIRRREIAFSLPAFILGLSALFLTGSRSAWLGFVISFLVLAVLLLPRQTLWRWAKVGTVPVLILAGFTLWAAVSVPAIRLAVFHSSPGDPHLLEGSSEKHWEAVVEGVRMVVQNPLGTGPGSAGPASFYNEYSVPAISENYFVQIGQEVGIMGLLLFLAINILVIQALYRHKDILSQLLLASFIGLSFMNLMQHTWADDPTAMTWWGLAGLVIAASSKIRKRTVL